MVKLISISFYMQYAQNMNNVLSTQKARTSKFMKILFFFLKSNTLNVPIILLIYLVLHLRTQNILQSRLLKLAEFQIRYIQHAVALLAASCLPY